MNRPLSQLLTVIGMPMMLVGGIVSKYNIVISVLLIVAGVLSMIVGALSILEDL